MLEFGKLKSKDSDRQGKPAGRLGAETVTPRDPQAPPRVKVDVWPSTDPNTTQTRFAERFVPRRTSTSLTTARGKRIDGRIVNLSATGVAVEVNMAQLASDTVTMVGSRPVEKGRSIKLGMVFLFVKPLDPSLCNPDIVL